MFGKENKNLLIGLVIIAFSIIGLFFSTNNSSNIILGVKDNVITPVPSEAREITKVPSISSQITRVLDKEIFEEEILTSETPNEENAVIKTTYPVVKVVDGDTIDVKIDGKVERLRLIGMDTPETVDPRKPVQCFGLEASKKAKELLLGQSIALERDSSQGERDKYKRLLRYVFLLDGTNFNKYMISEGYAHEYTYDKPYKYQLEFKQAERVARNNNKGLWSLETCSGNK